MSAAVFGFAGQGQNPVRIGARRHRSGFGRAARPGAFTPNAVGVRLPRLPRLDTRTVRTAADPGAGALVQSKNPPTRPTPCLVDGLVGQASELDPLIFQRSSAKN